MLIRIIFCFMRKLIFYSLLFSVLILVPVLVHADVFINEIAWMGTTSSANAEWIELYNSSPSSVILDGWSLIATDGSPSISLSGSLPGSGYFLLERTSDESVPSITAGVIYTGSMSNTGERFQLKDNLGNIEDEVDGTSGWQAGDNVTKQTMQRDGSSWITGTPTPGVQNAKKTETTEDENVSKETTAPPTVKPKEDDTSEDKFFVQPNPVFSARMIAPDVGTAGVAVPITVMVKQDGKRDLVTGKFEWSMGDGAWYRYDHNQPVNHIYYYPGTYTITLNYYSNLLKEEPDSVHKKTITIVPALIEFENKTDDGGIVLKNSSTKDIALDEWIVEYNGKKFTFPPYTSIAKSQSMSISSITLGFTIADGALLKNPSGITITKYPDYHESDIPEDETGEVKADQGDIPLQPLSPVEGVSASAVPEVKNMGTLWVSYKWYIIAGIIGLGAILAYFAMRLYADRDEII